MPRRQLANIRGEMLAWARESMNLALEEAAQKIGVKPERLAKWEAGEDRPTVNQLRKASGAFKRPLAAFFLPEPPKDFDVPHDFRRLPGEAPLTLSPEFITAIRRAQYRRAIALDLAEEVVDAPRQFIGSVSRSADVVSVGRNIRELLGVSLEQQRSWGSHWDALNAWKEAVEGVGVLVFHFAGVDVEEVRAFSLCEEAFPVIAVNGRDSASARIFSLLHEFSHLLLGHGGSCDLREARAPRSRDQQIEVFCNYVAGEVLVPRAALLAHPLVRQPRDLTSWDDRRIQDLARAFGVSREVILRRLLIAGKVSQDFYEAKRDELRRGREEGGERARGFLPVPQRAVRSVGQPFLRIVVNAYYREAITASELSEYLGVRLKHLPALEHLLSGRNVLTGGYR